MAAISALSVAAVPALAWAGVPLWAALAAPIVLSAGLTDLVRSLHQIFARPSILPEGVPDMKQVIVAVPVILRQRSDAAAITAFLRRNRVALATESTPVAFLADGPDEARVGPEDGAAVRKAALEAFREAQAEDPDLRLSLYWRDKAEDRWGRLVGVERKRGKLMAFLSGLDAGAPGLPLLGGTEVARSTPFVFVADLDTTLVFGTLRRLMAKAAHPSAGDVAIVTPRIASPRSDRRAWFAAGLFGTSKTDVLPTPRPSLRQDMTGEDLFFGKGLIRVSPFVARLKGELPQDIVLSHDHVEGMITGVLHASDASVLESVPQTLGQWLRRQHRWARGDTQNLAFVLPRGWLTRAPRGERLTMLDRAELTHNVVGHLAPAAMLVILASSLGMPSGAQAAWGVLGVGLCAGGLARVSAVLYPPLPERSRTKALDDLRQSLTGSAVRFSVMPALAVTSLDAVRRGLYALLCDPRHALDWPGAGRERPLAAAFVGALASGVLVLLATPANRMLVGVIAAAWVCAPFAFSRSTIRHGEIDGGS